MKYGITETEMLYALNKLNSDWQSSSVLKVNLNVLRELRIKGYVSYKVNGYGSVFSPCCAIEWRLKRGLYECEL